MSIFNKQKDDEFVMDLDDRLVVYDDEQNNCEIHYITEINEESLICAGHVIVPKADCTVATSAEGRVFFYKAPSESIREVERLARLEQSIVLKQITNYKPEPLPNPNMDLKFWALAALLFVAIIVAAF